MSIKTIDKRYCISSDYPTEQRISIPNIILKEESNLSKLVET